MHSITLGWLFGITILLGVSKSMPLTADELRWLRRCQKRERLWFLTRWVCVAIAILSFGISDFLFYQLIGPLRSEASRDAATLAWITPVVWLFFINGFAWLALISAKWRGDHKLRLLLRLISEHENNNAEPSASPKGAPPTQLGSSNVPKGPQSRN